MNKKKTVMLKRAFKKANKIFNKKEWRRAKKKYKALNWIQKTGFSAIFNERQAKKKSL